MIVLCFKASEKLYGIVSKDIVEVLPLIPIEPVLHAPDYIAGTLQYRSLLIPVIDVTVLLTQVPSAQYVSTRIVVVTYFPDSTGEEKRIALIVEQATETLKIDEKFLENKVIACDETAYLGPTTLVDDQLMQLIQVNSLLPDSLKEKLFPFARTCIEECGNGD